MHKYLVIGIFLTFSLETLALPKVPTFTKSKIPKSQVLLAKKKKSKKSRKKILSQEARSRKRKSRGGGSTNIDFSEASIDGSRRTPAGVALTSSKQDHEFDLIKLRTRWHDQMKISTTNLETGRGR